MKRYMSLAAIIALIFTGCGSESSSPKVTDKKFVYDIAGGNVPFPNDIFYLPAPNEPADGTLNVPYEVNSSGVTLIKELDRLDGFSTSSPLFISTNTLIDPTSLIGRIHIYEVNASLQGIMPIAHNVVNEFKDFRFVTQEDKIVIIPTKPFNSHTHYVVAIDRGVQNLDGIPVTPDETLRYLMGEGSGNAQLDALRPLYQQMLKATRRSIDDTVAIWSFTTQTIGARVAKVMEYDYSQAQLILQNLHLGTKDLLATIGIDSQLPNNDKLYVGLLKKVPYFLGLPTQNNPAAPIVTTANYEEPKSVDIPVLTSIPTQCEMPSTGWPIVIFQHGITQNRTNLLALAQTYASICYASIAIDLPLHGITDKTNPLYMPGYERTFDLDFLNNAASEPGSDGEPDPSGSWYINLQNPAISRDNILQSTADLMALRSAFGKVASLDGVKFDPNRVYYVGHSLGAMTPFPYLSKYNFRASLLANPGGGIAQLLNNSERFGPIIASALANAGLQKGSAAYSRYMLLTQTIIDDADPINYASALRHKKIFVYEVNRDRVIPNKVLGAPLSGTEPLLSQMNATNILKASIPLQPKVYVTKFLYGDHSSLLDPVYHEITKEMHSEMASYLASDGKMVQIEDTTLLAEEGDF